jgi:cytochrome c-type biogenesis protein CcmH
LFVLALLAVVGAIWLFVLLSAPPAETLDARVQDVASQLKCPICQGESVASSPSLLAQQMRADIRQRLQSGQSEQEVISYYVSRYGQQIVWSPQWQGFSLLAWLAPIVLLLGGALLLFFILRGWHRMARAHPSGEDDPELANVDEAELKRYRTQLERELAADDPLFAPQRTEAS